MRIAQSCVLITMLLCSLILTGCFLSRQMFLKGFHVVFLMMF